MRIFDGLYTYDEENKPTRMTYKNDQAVSYTFHILGENPEVGGRRGRK